MPVPTPRPVIDPVERELDRMTQRLAADLRGARGDARKEEAALRAALAAYAAAKARMGAPATEGAVTFFAIDGIGHRKERTPALAAARGTTADATRWLKTLRRLVESDKGTRARAARKKPAKPTAKPVANKPSAKKPPKR